MTADDGAQWIDDDRALARLVTTLSGEREYGLDTEFVAERSYWPRLCLLQVAWPGGVALVDPLACDVHVLRPVLDGPGTMITHAGGADIPIIDRACGARPTMLFDTQVAAGFVGLGTPSLVSLVRGVLGEQLDKSQQLTDWSRRPLPEGARRYAAGDVAHLLTLADELRSRLATRGRGEWATAECEALRAIEWPASDPETAWWKIKGSRSMRGERARVAQAVTAWRERRARELDRPARFVLSELVLTGIAARPPRDEHELTRMRGAESLPRHVARDVLAAVEAGRAMDRADQRLPPRHDDDASLDAAVGLLTAWVGQVAASEEVEPRLLATRDDLKALVNKRPNRLDDGWRAEMVGDRLRALLAGDAVLRLIDGGRGVALEPSPDGARARE